MSAENKRQLWVPEGFAHGFYVLSDEAEFVYKCTDYYNPKAEHSLIWNDPTVGIDWPLQGEPNLRLKDLARQSIGRSRNVLKNNSGRLKECSSFQTAYNPLITIIDENAL